MENEVRTVPERLRAAADLFEERNAAYGGNYLLFGRVLHEMFPSGVTVDTPDAWRRVALVVHLMTKMTRYACNATRGEGHRDSLEDMSVYAQMLSECDDVVSSAKLPNPAPAPAPYVSGDGPAIFGPVLVRLRTAQIPDALAAGRTGQQHAQYPNNRMTTREARLPAHSIVRGPAEEPVMLRRYSWRDGVLVPPSYVAYDMVADDWEIWTTRADEWRTA